MHRARCSVHSQTVRTSRTNEVFFTGTQRSSKPEWDGKGGHLEKRQKGECSPCFELGSEHCQAQCFALFFCSQLLFKVCSCLHSYPCFYNTEVFFLLEMCFKTESMFPYKTLTTLLYSGQFLDLLGKLLAPACFCASKACPMDSPTLYPACAAQSL